MSLAKISVHKCLAGCAVTHPDSGAAVKVPRRKFPGVLQLCAKGREEEEDQHACILTTRLSRAWKWGNSNGVGKK